MGLEPFGGWSGFRVSVSGFPSVPIWFPECCGMVPYWDYSVPDQDQLVPDQDLVGFTPPATYAVLVGQALPAPGQMTMTPLSIP